MDNRAEGMAGSPEVAMRSVPDGGEQLRRMRRSRFFFDAACPSAWDLSVIVVAARCDSAALIP